LRPARRRFSVPAQFARRRRGLRLIIKAIPNGGRLRLAGDAVSRRGAAPGG
jgi:hypothetical protein